MRDDGTERGTLRNLDATRTLIIKWLDEFGLRSESVSVQLITDAEVAVGNLIAGCDSRFTFEVRKAVPQSHKSAGHAERAVRTVKESLTTLMLDHERQFGLGLDSSV